MAAARHGLSRSWLWNPSTRYLQRLRPACQLISSGRSITLLRRLQSATSKNMEMSGEGRVYILGVGNLGRFFAHALAREQDPPPLTLLLHRRDLMQDWDQAGRAVEITMNNGCVSRSDNLDVEVVGSDSNAPIDNLILATKSIHSVSALKSIKHRLSNTATIMIVQNGMGAREAIEKEITAHDVSTNAAIRLVPCITSHGLYSLGPFRSVHAGIAHTTVSRDRAETAQYLVDKIVKAQLLVAQDVASEEFLQLQLTKLVINSMINPLTVIFNCRNGELFGKPSIYKVMKLLLKEASDVLQATGEGSPGESFSVKSLEKVVLDVATKTAGNTSSMLQDFRAGQETEIDYINGYLVARGKKVGVDCKNNEKVVQMVKAGKVISQEEVKEFFPQITDIVEEPKINQ